MDTFVDGKCCLCSFDTVQKWIICDIDGTINHSSHRVHLVTGVEKNWDAFHLASVDDLPKEEVIEILRLAKAQLWNICFITGRPSRYRELTQEWLERHHIPVDALLMRSNGDFRADSMMKKMAYERYFGCSLRAGHRVMFVLEDRDRVVEMWRGLGLICLQVQKGEY